jgi:hypothetical protein
MSMFAKTKRRRFASAAAFGLACAVLLARSEETKPPLKVASDGWPAGHATPEGIACDFARAFIKRDPALLTNSCLRPFGDDELRKKYQEFLGSTIDGIKQEAARVTASPGGPKQIGKLYAARPFSKSGPASYGRASFGFQEVEFVDVGVFLQSGAPSVTRTLVVQGKNGLWYVDPAPRLTPLLSDGLNDEAKSTKDFTQAYAVQK